MDFQMLFIGTPSTLQQQVWRLLGAVSANEIWLVLSSHYLTAAILLGAMNLIVAQLCCYDHAPCCKLVTHLGSASMLLTSPWGFDPQ